MCYFPAKNQKHTVISTRTRTRRKFDFFAQTSWFFFDSKHFCEENYAVSVTLIKTSQINVFFKVSCQSIKWSNVRFFICKSLVIRQKGESQNRCFKKTKHVRFSQNRTFVTPLIRTRTQL